MSGQVLTSESGKVSACPGNTRVSASQQSSAAAALVTGGSTPTGGEPQKRTGRLGSPWRSTSRSWKKVTQLVAQSSLLSQLVPLPPRHWPRENCCPAGQLQVPSGTQPLLQPELQHTPDEQLPDAHCAPPLPQAPPLLMTQVPLLVLHDCPAPQLQHWLLGIQAPLQTLPPGQEKLHVRLAPQVATLPLGPPVQSLAARHSLHRLSTGSQLQSGGGELGQHAPARLSAQTPPPQSICCCPFPCSGQPHVPFTHW